MGNRWWTNILLAGISTLICLLLSEGVVRLTGKFQPRSGGLADILIHDDTLGWRGIPNSTKIHVVGRTETEIKTNEIGFRDNPLSFEENSGDEKRILFLGDSFCWGFGTPQDKRISEWIESLDSRIESYNFGMFGYSTDQELLTLRMYGDKVQPDIVVLLFCINDLLTNDSDEGHRLPKPRFSLSENGTLKLTNIPVPRVSKSDKAINWLRGHSALFNAAERTTLLIQEKLALKKQRQLAEKSDEYGRSETPVSKSDLQSGLLKRGFDGTGITKYLLRDIQAECNRLGASFILLMVPSSMIWTQRHAETPPEAILVLDWCRELGIHAFDLFPIFHERYKQTGENLYVDDFQDRMHWNENGHKLAAEALYPHLMETLTNNGVESSPELHSEEN